MNLAACALALFAASLSVANQAPAQPIAMKAPTIGAVMFPHSADIQVAGKCEVCRHASKPEKPLKAPQEVCTDCHAKPPRPPVNTSLQAAFHNATATSGLRISCHKTANTEGKAAPVKCADCHKKERV